MAALPDSGVPAPTGGEAVLELLQAEQSLARSLLERYARLRGHGTATEAARAGLARRLCAELAVQLQIEEELLYPELRDVLHDKHPIDQSQVEHQCMRALVERLMEMAPADPLFDARVVVLGELLERHLAREARELYPLALAARIDVPLLGLALVQRRDELLADLADGHIVPWEVESPAA